MLAERGLDLTYETVRRWVTKFGPLFAKELRKRRPRPTSRWHLDEMVVKIAGKRNWLWRAVDEEGEVLDILVQSRRDTPALGRVIQPLLIGRSTRSARQLREVDSPARSCTCAASLKDTNSVKSRTRFVLRVSPCVRSQSVP